MSPPSQYRPIQPAPTRGARSGASSGSPGSNFGWLSAKGLTKRLKAVAQACHTCRRNKAKCDGARPTCSGCTARGAQCGYEGEVGQSRQTALRVRLEVLEKLLSDLQSLSDEDAERLYQRVRSASAEDIVSLCREVDSQPAHAASLAAPSTSPECSFSDRSSGTSPQADPTSRATTQSIDASSSSAAATPPTNAPRRLRAEDLANLLRLDLPRAETTWAGIQSFFNSCGKLFHVFSQQQMDGYYRAVFGSDGTVDTSQKLAICCLYSCAAVGIQYTPGDFEKGMEEIFHDVSRRFFPEVMEERPLDTIKVCTLYAMYNILNKATVALAYVEIGLSMSKRQSQSTGVCHPSMLSSEQWIDFRRTWRTLIFFASWLSSTLGYISGDDDSEFATLAPIAELDHDSYSAELGELVQAEMTKISLLKAGILRNHLAVPELTTLGMDGIIRELQDWHGQLPEPMKLRSLCRDDWPPLVRWSLYHLHLLYSGAFMLVYRRIAAHCVRLQRKSQDLAGASHNMTLLSLVEQGVTSARDTARIVSLLLNEQGVFKRCWIVIFQAHTACIVILHSVAQKQLHRFPPSAWKEDMERAQQCIDVLGYCGQVDPVALRLEAHLSGIYTSLSQPSPDPGPAPSYATPEQHPIAYLFTTPPSPNPALLNLSFGLLFALCRPWSDTPATITAPILSTNTTTTTITTLSPTGTDSTTVNEPQPDFLEGLDWNFNKVAPFRWDTDSMGIPKAGEAVVEQQSCFLDSEGPSGWTVAEDLDVDLDLDGDGEGEGAGQEGLSVGVEDVDGHDVRCKRG